MLTGVLKNKGGGAPEASDFGGMSTEAKAAEKRFHDLIDSIDKAIDEADAKRKHTSEPEDTVAIPLPRGLAPGSDDWNDLERPIFEACDRDGSGWISFREAQESLGLERNDFALYDRDHDGRVGSREFMTRYSEVLQATGVFPLPKPVEGANSIVPRSPKQLAAAYDANADGALDVAEIGQMLKDYDREEIDPKVALERIDDDGSGRVDGDEIAQLSRLVSTAFVLTDPKTTRKPAHAAEEMFCEVVDRTGGRDAAPLPPRINGPVTQFRRLDLDGDGYITLAELQELQAPLSMSVRASAVLAALDADEDNRISRKEYLDSLRPTR